ncbi:uncharacterized protein LOC133731549 isoform X1 [Rosa rugosa]|uniref:uncharacterized protein LOC133731549 isoform X1 n=1 Tax=Rosa rugosa TaxID=74645 RepID=UPI002B40DD0B|nr:uncharacterized protein LOC133731549 isoform X1 [Rosa rugosa]
MAKRSDFAQKLLDDLRVRKERMAAPAQSSNRSNAMAIDAYAYSKQTYRGSRDTKTHGITSSRTGNPQSRSTRSSRTPIRQEASNQMVAYGRGGNSGQIVDLSMALAFALENGATKLTRTSSSSKSSVMGFLNQIGRGSMDFKKMERKGNVNMYWGSSSQFPNLSNFHIEEISRGAQKLNQILRACSNGVNVDKFSIEIGKELFKGAMDLEESLRMLVNLQEASEHMTTSQRKSRITLLDEDEDGEDQIEEQKQLALPRFSFDKSTRHARKIQEVGRMALKPKMAALTYPTGGSTDEKQGRETATSVSRRHSVSYIPDVKNPSKQSDQKVSKLEKDRIPNVIAKLMGLDELPKNENAKSTTTQKDNIPKKPRERGAAIGHTTQESNKIVGVKTKDGENLVSTSRQKVVEGNKNPLMQKNTAFLLQAEKVLPANNNVGLEMVIHDGKQSSKDLMGIKPVTRSGKTTTMKTDKQQSAQFRQNSSKDNHERERKQDTMRYGEQKLQVRKQQDTEMVSKSTSNKAAKQPHTSQARVNRNSMIEVVNAVQPRGVPNGTYHENLVRRKSSAELNIHMNDFPQKDSDQENLGIPPAMKEKAVHHVAPLQKAKTRRVNKSEIPRRVDEVVTRRNGTLNKLTRPPKQSILEQVTHRTHDKVSGHSGAEKGRASRLKQAEPRIVKSNKSTESTRPLHLVQNLQKEAEAPTFYGHNEDEFRSLREPKTLVPHDSRQNSVSVVPNDQHDQVPIFGADECITSPNALNVAGTQSTHEDTLDISSTLQLEQQKPFKWRKQEPLTETEILLKQIVIQSQLFLNTAEALFRLEIPFGILHASSSDYDHEYKYITHPEDIKLTLDCSYEIMKRKGKRQELAVHPNFVKVSISFTQVQSLDELVKQLSKDIDKLKLYGKNGKLECGAEEYVPRMLEFDVNNREPELNCMWDLGWDVTMFGFVEVDEVVRDLERGVLSVLVDELTRDLFHM